MMNEDKYCLDLQNNEFKQHTSAWKNIPEAILKNSSSHTSKDEKHIKELIENIGKVMNKEMNKLDKDSWIKILIETKDIIAARNKKRIVRIFGISLASSDPK
jgi:adenylyl- and sulfurtransferase ThiI